MAVPLFARRTEKRSTFADRDRIVLLEDDEDLRDVRDLEISAQLRRINTTLTSMLVSTVLLLLAALANLLVQ